MVSLMSAVAMAIVLFFLPGITGLVSVMEMPKTDSARVAASSLERTRFRYNPYSEWHIHGNKERSTLKDPHKKDQSELVGYVGNTLQLQLVAKLGYATVSLKIVKRRSLLVVVGTTPTQYYEIHMHFTVLGLLLVALATALTALSQWVVALLVTALAALSTLWRSLLSFSCVAF